MVQRLVLFDLDDTLVDRRKALAAAVTRFADRHRLTAAEREGVLGRLGERACLADFAALRELHGLAVPAGALWQQYAQHMAESVLCPAEVLEGLDALRVRGWRIAIATNGPGDVQRAKLDATGLAARVHAVCVSGELGFRKPDPRMFAAAVRSCGAHPGEGGWMVGDDPVKDIIGGRSAGLTTLWIGRAADWPATLPAPDRIAPTALRAIRLLLALTPEE
ncbi:HAD family hydrolase [Streptomyces subrutilus]|uniref:HAD family hydrolase n=1 Tax=Streptomyces subrutilus TaxID=36818 RepID=UPI003F4D65DB